MKTTNKANWTARCKSGFEFHGRACARLTPRGALMCETCLSAVVVPTAPKVGLLARVVLLLSAVVGR
jgi:hypothetical protein